MSHYDIDYSGLTEEQKYTKALQDCKVYLGAKIYKQLLPCLVGHTLDSARIALSFAGIQGYPAKAMWQEANDSRYDQKASDQLEARLSREQGW